MTRTLRVGLSCLCVAGLTTLSSAQAISGSLSISVGGVSAYNQNNTTSTNLNLNDKFTFSTIPLLGANSFVSGSTGDFNAVPAFTGITQNTLNLVSLTGYSWTSSFGEFQASVLTIGANTYTPYATIGTNAAGQKTLNVYEYGVFTPSGTLSNYSAANMAETISFTQTIVNGSISYSASAATMAPVPESNSIVAMGLGLVGLIGLRRIRNRKQ